MDDLPIAKSLRQARTTPYDPAPMQKRIEELLKQHNESFREASLSSGLDHQAIRRIRAGYRPQIPVCILLADHFGINPNELLDPGRLADAEGFRYSYRERRTCLLKQ